MRSTLLLLLALLLLPLAACGDDTGKNTKPDDATPEDATPRGAPPAKPDAPKPEEPEKPAVPTATGGATSPQALVDAMQGLPDDGFFPAMVSYTLPEHRSVLSFIGLIGPSMALAFGAGGDNAEAIKAGLQDIYKKHKVTLDDTVLMSTAQGMGAIQDDPASVVASMDKVLGHVDHSAFLTEVFGFLDKNMEGRSNRGAKGMKDVKIKDIKIDGDTASVTAEGRDEPMTLRKRGGRWFIDFVSMMKSMPRGGPPGGGMRRR